MLLSSAAHAEERPSPGDRAADLRALCEAHRRAGQPGIGRGAIERSRQSASGGAEQAGDGTSTDPESEALAARLDEALRQLRGGDTDAAISNLEPALEALEHRPLELRA
ncbi:MAG: hypothetical protein MI919_31670, partial [Holophagales bacterium]|nr:hypothetical protein [Holophagales bacterium]